ncbi:hypothetical protein HC928_03610 [bacterium]|nr:hypothetical protein [bacterium]
MAATSSGVVLVKDPTALPEGFKHHEAVDALAKVSKLVVLMSHGNKYKFPKNWILPSNAVVLEYELDMGSITKCIIRLKELLREHGIDLHSRHLDGYDPMPMPLAGSVLVLNLGTNIQFINKPDEYTAPLAINPVMYDVDSEWDIL